MHWPFGGYKKLTWLWVAARRRRSGGLTRYAQTSGQEPMYRRHPYLRPRPPPLWRRLFLQVRLEYQNRPVTAVTIRGTYP